MFKITHDPISGLPFKMPAPAIETVLRVLDGVSEANANSPAGSYGWNMIPSK